MIRLTPKQIASLKPWFLPERPGPLIGSHVIQTGHGACLVDRWPAPRVVLVETAGNYTLSGEAQVLAPADLQPHIEGFVDTTEAFAPLLRAAFPDVKTWPRIAFAQPDAPNPVAAGDVALRRLEPSDRPHLERFDPDSAWISNTWGGPAALAGSGFGWGAFVAGRLASIACTFFLGETYEDIGVVTEPDFRGLGLSVACADALCRDIRARDHQPTWTTSPDNTASLRVAEKLGFVVQRQHQLYVVGIPIPESAEPPPD
jgi:RimJ/RimL family protein N-acetyltransferase